jgi:hypothetical protein
VPEQEADLLEGGPSGQVVNVVARIGEDAAVSIQVTNRRRGCDDILETGFGGRFRRHEANDTRKASGFRLQLQLKRVRSCEALKPKPKA